VEMWVPSGYTNVDALWGACMCGYVMVDQRNAKHEVKEIIN
jgi:hypothetical protein